MNRKGILNSLWSAGSVLLGKFCPLCYPAIGAFLAAMGFGAAVGMTLFKWLLILLLTMGIVGLWRSSLVHGRRWPLLMAVLSAVLIYTGKYFWTMDSVFYIGAVGLVASVIIDLRFARGKAVCTACNGAVLERR